MFDFFDKKTKKTIMSTIIITLIFEFMAVFLSYSSLQVKEYLVRAENTSKQNSKYIDLCMSHYENSVSFLIKNHSDKFKTANQIELYNLFKEFMLSNTNTSNIFFYNDSLTVYYDTLPSPLNNYISENRQNKNTNAEAKWDLYGNQLLYSTPISSENKLYGHLVICVSDSALVTYSKTTNPKDISNIITLLRTQNEIKPLKGITESVGYDLRKLPVFSDTEYSRTNLSTCITNTPLNGKDISVMNIIFIAPAYKRTIVLGIALVFVLIISIFSARYFINKYNKFLVTRLERLSENISKIPHNLSKEEIHHENFKQN